MPIELPLCVSHNKTTLGTIPKFVLLIVIFALRHPQLIPMVSQALVHLPDKGELGINALGMLGKMLVHGYELGL